jgi:hypothetical protein
MKRYRNRGLAHRKAQNAATRAAAKEAGTAAGLKAEK